jgi:hypothetical protein
VSCWRLTTPPFLCVVCRFFFDRHSIVDSVGGDQDRAVDALLAMSDPDHVPVQHTVANEQPSPVRHVIILPHTHTPPMYILYHRPIKPSWTRSLRASCCSRTSSSMPATRSRCDSNSRRSTCASSLMRSAITRRSTAAILRSNSNSRRSSGIRCRTCRNSLANSPKVRLLRFPSPRPGFASLACLHSLSQPSCSWQTHVQLLGVESESQSSRFRPAEVRRIFTPLRMLRPYLPPLLRTLCRPRAGEGRGNTTFTDSLIRRRLTGTPQTRHHLAQARASAQVMLLNRLHLEWIDTRSKHITRQGSHQTRRQEQSMMISRVSAFWAPLCFWLPSLASAPPLRRYRYRHPFSRSAIGVLPLSSR